MKIGATLSAVVLSSVALAHLLRLVTDSVVTIDGWLLPQWISIVGVIIPSMLVLLLIRER